MAVDIVAEALGAGAAVCSMASFAPQIFKICRQHDAASVSLRMYLISLLGFGLWTAYGVVIGRWPVILCNTVCLAMCAAILVLKWRTSGSEHASSRPAPPP